MRVQVQNGHLAFVRLDLSVSLAVGLFLEVPADQYAALRLVRQREDVVFLRGISDVLQTPQSFAVRQSRDLILDRKRLRFVHVTDVFRNRNDFALVENYVFNFLFEPELRNPLRSEFVPKDDFRGRVRFVGPDAYECDERDLLVNSIIRDLEAVAEVVMLRVLSATHHFERRNLYDRKPLSRHA